MCIVDEATVNSGECVTELRTPFYDEPWFWMVMTFLCWLLLMAVLWLLKVCPHPELRHHYLNLVCRRLGCRVRWGGRPAGQGHDYGLGQGHVPDMATVRIFVTAATVTTVTTASSHVVDLPPSYDMVACYVNPASGDLPSYDEYITAMTSPQTLPAARDGGASVTVGPRGSDVTQPS